MQFHLHGLNPKHNSWLRQDLLPNHGNSALNRAHKVGHDYIAKKMDYEDAIKHGLQPVEPTEDDFASRILRDVFEGRHGISKGALSGNFADYENPELAMQKLEQHPAVQQMARDYIGARTALRDLEKLAVDEGVLSKYQPIRDVANKLANCLEIMQKREEAVKQFIDKAIFTPEKPSVSGAKVCF